MPDNNVVEETEVVETEVITSNKCGCCCPAPEPEPPFKRPVEDCETVITYVPCDSRIPTITSNHYVYEDDMPHFHYDVGSIQIAKEYFGKEQQKVVKGKVVGTVFNEGYNFVVNQPNVNPPLPSVHLSPVPELTGETTVISDPLTGETMEVTVSPEA